MYPASFEYLAPRGVNEAIALLQQYGEDAKLLAGGQSLVPMMKLRLARPRYLIDLNRIPSLNTIREEQGHIHIGSMTRHAQIEESSLVGEKLPMLREAARQIADQQVRNRGTLGGSLAEADPSGDLAPVALALKAEMKCVGPQGERRIAAADFFIFAYTSALESHEILTEIIFPVPVTRSAGVYLKLEPVAGAFAIVSAAVQMALDGNGFCQSIGIGVTGRGSVPQQAVSVENLLKGKKIMPELIEESGRLIQDGAEPIEDMRGSAAYKKKALGAILRRALNEVVRRAEASKVS
jgi:aerobic carbon-monoxide dehydrogenase medium subunit